MNLFDQYRNGNLESVLNGMETKEIQKLFRQYGFGKPLTKKDKLIPQFIRCLEREYNKGNSFLKAF